jgi:hypothetical protein
MGGNKSVGHLGLEVNSVAIYARKKLKKIN